MMRVCGRRESQISGTDSLSFSWVWGGNGLVDGMQRNNARDADPPKKVRCNAGTQACQLRCTYIAGTPLFPDEMKDLGTCAKHSCSKQLWVTWLFWQTQTHLEGWSILRFNLQPSYPTAFFPSFLACVILLFLQKLKSEKHFINLLSFSTFWLHKLGFLFLVPLCAHQRARSARFGVWDVERPQPFFSPLPPQCHRKLSQNFNHLYLKSSIWLRVVTTQLGIGPSLALTQTRPWHTMWPVPEIIRMEQDIIFLQRPDSELQPWSSQGVTLQALVKIAGPGQLQFLRLERLTHTGMYRQNSQEPMLWLRFHAVRQKSSPTVNGAGFQPEGPWRFFLRRTEYFGDSGDPHAVRRKSQAGEGFLRTTKYFEDYVSWYTTNDGLRNHLAKKWTLPGGVLDGLF